MVSISVVESHASLQLRKVFWEEEGRELVMDRGPGPKLRSSNGPNSPTVASKKNWVDFYGLGLHASDAEGVLYLDSIQHWYGPP